MNFNGLRVLSLESRRATEVARLIEKYGGQPIVAPALREIPLESNVEALDFAAGLLLGEYDIVVFLTGVGARALVTIVERVFPGDEFLSALSKAKVVARGPKPSAVLRELKVPLWIIAPEPSTWREVLSAMEARTHEQPLRGARIAVQEYGASNEELIDALTVRGASVTRVPVYRWALPEDIEPLEKAVWGISNGAVDVLMLTSGVQLAHLWQVAATMNCEEAVKRGLEATAIASIGPTTSEEIRRHDLQPDLEASHPKLGFLVKEAAEKAADLLSSKRIRSADRNGPPNCVVHR
jgi:uroporphyrinogen-III synthase